jgi:hypothetical protein
MMSFLAYITGFFMNFEILPILTGSTDTFLEGGHPRIISAKFG